MRYTTMCLRYFFSRLKRETSHVVAMRQTLRTTILKSLEFICAYTVASLNLKRRFFERTHKLSLKFLARKKWLTAVKFSKLLGDHLT